MVKIEFNHVVIFVVCIISVEGWASWTSWTTCPASCGTGLQYRYRTCHCNTCICSGSWTAWRYCTGNRCRVNGGWSLWLTWGSCSSSCDGGTRYRSRHCNNPVPNYGGSYCAGLPSENGICNTNRCPVDGQWGMWSNWTMCDTSCGEGYQNRSRSCDSPAPDYGGSDCSGSKAEDRQCNFEACPEKILGEENNCSVGAIAGTVIGSIVLTGVVFVLLYIFWQRRRNILDKKHERISEERHRDTSQHNPSYVSSDQNAQVLNQEDNNCGQDVYENLKI